MPPRATAKSSKTARQRQVKVVITGPFGAGKTSLIKTISEIAVLATERKVTDETQSVKAQTTVAMDFGRITVDRDLALYLFGTPGQKRFEFMWEILADGMLGFIILIDAQREHSHAEAEEILTFFRDVAEVPFVVAVNKCDDDPDGGVRRAREWLQLPPSIRCVPVNALDRESVKGVLLELLQAVLDEIDAGEPAAV
jgi:uncharacterized protein